MESSVPLRFPDVIKDKRDGKTLEEEEIAFFIKGVVQEKVDYAQIGAMLMAIYYKYSVAKGGRYNFTSESLKISRGHADAFPTIT